MRATVIVLAAAVLIARSASAQPPSQASARLAGAILEGTVPKGYPEPGFFQSLGWVDKEGQGAVNFSKGNSSHSGKS